MQRHKSYKPSGVKWIGDVPAHWDVRPGFTCFDENKDRNKKLTEKTVLSLSYGRIVVKPEEKLTGLVPESFDTYQLIKPGDIVIRTTDLQNDKTSLRVGLAKDKGMITSAYLGLRCKPEINPEYVFRLLESYDALKVFYGMGSGLRQNIDFWDFKRLPIPLPTRAEQDRIVIFIDQKAAEINAAIAKKLRLIELLNEQKKIFVETLVCRGLGSAVPTRNSGIDSVGTIPEHWSIKKLGHLANVVRGASPRPAGDPRYFSSEGGVSWVTVAEVTKDESLYLRETKESLTPIGARQSQEFRRGTVIFTNSGATLGVPKILDIDCCANDGIVALKRLSNEVNKEFLYYFLSTTTERLREEMKQGGGQPNLNTGIVKSIAVPLPPTQEQEEIVQCINLLLGKQQTLLRQTRTSIEQLQRLKDTLVADVVAGKLKV